MNVQTIFKSAMVVAALIAATITTNADANDLADVNDLTEASRKQLLEMLNNDSVIVVMPSQNDTVELVSASEIATTSEDETLLSEAVKAEVNALFSSGAIQLVSGESCGCADSCETNCCPETCSTGCGTCGTDCCEPEQGLIAGVEAIFYWVDGNVNGSGDIRTFDVNRNLIRKYNATGVDDDGGYVTPRLWLGYQRGNWGIVGRWWDLNLGNNDVDPLDGFLNNTGSGTTSDFRSYAGDIEIFRAFCTDACWGNVSFGYRHGRLSSSGSSITVSDQIGIDYVTGSSYGESSFNGNGFTFGLELHKSIGCGVNLFAKARGSFLWGNSKATAAATTTLDRPIGGAFDGHFATASGDSGYISIAEIQAGVEWTHELKCYPASAFLRCAFEWQSWQGDNDVRATADSFSEAVPGARIESRSGAGDFDIDLFGIAVSTGFTF